ncbi:unnamed protein product [Rotaria sp. Silwood1]|nr:unnamed protein product [Rotaria sp. Silwood1]CAF1666442.1 unnamed protein product [Rotaria sp. Silwood1]CAF3887178.1 unnamed protein product [Rotaria sp. Silwood1]CAF5107706.1 unnamed protein product [Rotaria sp. Silwood1]
MAPKRKTVSKTSCSKTNNQQHRFSQRVIAMAKDGTNKSISSTQQKKQSRSARQKKKYQQNENEFNDIEEENPKSMNIDFSDVDSDNQELSTSNSCSNTSIAGDQVKPSSNVEFDIADDDDSNEFQAMFMSNGSLSKSRSNCSSTPLVRSVQNKLSAVRATTEPASSNQMKKQTRDPLSTIAIGHQSTMSNINMRNVNTPTNPRISTSSSPATQPSVGNQSLSSINYTTNNTALLETFVEYRTLRRDLQRALQQNEVWKSDYRALTRQMERLQNNSFPRPNADGRAFLEQLLESLRASEQIADNRTPSEIANAIGIPEIALLSSSNIDPQKTALNVFNHIFSSNQEKESLINVANLNVKYPNLLNNILVWSKRCTPGCAYTMSMLKDAIGNSIRCARHKLKTEQARLAVVVAGNQFEAIHVNDHDVEIMSQDDD